MPPLAPPTAHLPASLPSPLVFPTLRTWVGTGTAARRSGRLCGMVGGASCGWKMAKTLMGEFYATFVAVSRTLLDWRPATGEECSTRFCSYSGMLFGGGRRAGGGVSLCHVNLFLSDPWAAGFNPSPPTSPPFPCGYCV